LPTLDGWRAIAIVMVIVSHGQSSFFLRPEVHKVAPYGRLGVDIFFAISGLLICSRLLDELGQSHISLRAFYIRRIFRILPPYLFYLGVLGLLTTLGAVDASPAEFMICLVFLRNYFMTAFVTGPLTLYTNHFWSLAVEEHFYLLWPVTLRWLGARRSVPAAIAACMAIHIWRGVNTRSSELMSFFRFTGVLWRTDTRLDALLWGCVAALLLPRLTPVFARFASTLALVAGLVAATWIRLPMLPLFYAIGFAALVVSTVSNPTSYVSRVLELAPVRWVGRLSYSLYIWQTIFFEQRYPSGWLGQLQQPPNNLIALAACAIGSYYLIEKPAIRLGRRLANPSAPQLESQSA
jgi:peptidoglycan/LPS O-acetylase OafA/YrhL